jgi:hypothetical protein
VLVAEVAVFIPELVHRDLAALAVVVMLVKRTRVMVLRQPQTQEVAAAAQHPPQRIPQTLVVTVVLAL